jgi:hypothetical protein
MSERVSVGAAGQALVVSGGDIRRAGHTKVTAGHGMIVVPTFNVAG